MKNVKFVLSLVLVSILAAAGCGFQNQEVTAAESVPEAAGEAPPAAVPAGHSGEVLETMDAAGYTYIKLGTAEGEIWAAAPKTEVQVGQQLSLPPGMAMENFHSETLDRDFPVIYFVGGVMGATGSGGSAQMPAGHPPVGGAKGAPEVELGAIEVAADGTTVAGVHASKNELAGKEISVRGKVVKVNNGIMGRNWLHLQDGSGEAEAGTNDLTVTSDATAPVGATVVVKGTLAVDKDFGAGYRYEVILEDASLKLE